MGNRTMIFLTDSIDHLSGPILGRVADDTGNCVTTETNNRSINILVIGERGTGKSEDYAANAVLQAVKQSRNIICSDDNICEFAAHEEMLSRNYTIITLDRWAIDRENICRWNPLCELLSCEAEPNASASVSSEQKNEVTALSSILAKAIIKNAQPVRPCDEDILIHTITNAILSAVSEKATSFDRVAEIIECEAAKQSDVWNGHMQSCVQRVLNSFMLNRAATDSQKQLVTIQDILSTENPNPVAIFLKTGKRVCDTDKELYSAFLGMLFFKLKKYDSEQTSQSHEFSFIFDDFQNIGYIPQFADILYDTRKNPYNSQKTQISIIVEKTADLQAAYGVELNRLLASIDVTVGFHYNNNPSMLKSWLKKSSAAKECNVSVYDMDSQRELNLIGLSYLDHPMIK